jgi:streptogramin lyase
LSKTESASRPTRQPTRWTRKRLVIAIGVIFAAGIVAAALDLRFAIGGSPRSVEPNSLLVLNPRTGATERDEKLGYGPGTIRLAGGHATVSDAAGTPSGRAPCQGVLLVSAAGYGWYACHAPDTLLRVPSAGGEAMKVAGISAAPEGGAYGAGRVWVVESDQNRLIAINPFTAKVVQAVTVGNEPVAVAVGYGAVWVANAGFGSVTRLDLRSGKVETIELDYQPTAIAAGAGAIWVVSKLGHVVIRIDPRKRVVTKTIRLANPPVDVAAGDGHVWVAIGH